MDTFYGIGHIPGAEKAWPVELDVDWTKKEKADYLGACLSNPDIVPERARFPSPSALARLLLGHTPKSISRKVLANS